MSVQSADAILLEVRDLAERDRVVTFLTRERGKLSGVAKGAKTKHSRFGGQIQPLARVRATWFEKDKWQMVRLSSVELVRAARGLGDDLEGLLLTSYLAEHASTFIPENEPSELPYRLLDSVLDALAAGVDRQLATRYFEAWILRLAGIYPAPEVCPGCLRPFEAGGVIPPGGEQLVCYECAGMARRAEDADGADGPEGDDPDDPTPGFRAVHAGPEALDFLRRISRHSLAKVAADPPSAAALGQVERLNTRVRRDFLQGELKSHRVMRQALQAPGP